MYRSRTPAAAIHSSFAHGGSMSTREIKAHLEVMFAPGTDHGTPPENAGSVFAHQLSEAEENTVLPLADIA